LAAPVIVGGKPGDCSKPLPKLDWFASEVLMVRFCANLSMLFAEVPFLERFGRAKAAGFDAVEFQFPYEFKADDIRAELDRHGLQLILFNFPAGDFAAGDRGLASDPGRVEEFQGSMAKAMDYARVLKPAKLNCMAGKSLEGVDHAIQWSTLIGNLTTAADLAAAEGIMLVTEPLNPHDAPGFFLPTPGDGFRAVMDAAHPNLRVEYDLYHAQRTEGNLVETIRANIGAIGHIQLADAPDRHEPGTGEIEWAPVFAAIDSAGYRDWIGLEYKPSTERTEHSLGWMEEYGA
jgi:hydroxypyruvate isomerase